MKKRTINIYLVAFTIPFIIMCMAFGLLKIYPFGNRQILTIDAWHQYYPFLVELKRKLKDGESLLYCWRLGMGNDFVSLIAYYLASPLNLFVLFFPDSLLREAFTLFILIKIGLSGSFCAFSLNRLNGKKEYGVIIFSTFYALCGWTIGYYWNIMWLDTFAVFPLVVLGIYLLVKEKKYKLYTISLTISIIANYYIGLMVCIFTAIFFLAQCIINKNKWKEMLANFKRIIIFSFLSLMMSAVVILPTMVTLQNAYKSDNAPTRWLVKRGWLETLSNSFAYLKPTSTGGRPYIYCGILCIIFLIAFCRQASVRERRTYGITIYFLLISTNINILDYIWHGLHVANSMPYRYTFIYSFLLVMVAYFAYSNVDILKDADIKAICSIGIAYYLAVVMDIVYRHKKNGEDTYMPDIFGVEELDFWLFLSLNLLIIAAYLIIIALKIRKKLSKKVFTLCLAAIAGLELIPTVLIGTQAIGTTDRSNYPDRYDAVEEVLSCFEEYRGQDIFYRTELTSRHGWNAAALYGYNGASFFSSNSNAAVTVAFENMGLGARLASNRRHYLNSTPVNNVFLNLKYLISRGTEAVNQEYLTEVAHIDDVYGYRNEAYLPIGFMVEKEMTDFHLDGNTPFEIQNNLLKTASGITENVFIAVEVVREEHQNLEVTKSEYGLYQYQKPEEVEGKASFYYEMPEDGAAYVFMDLKTENRGESTVKLEFNNRTHSYTVFNNGSFFPAGTYRKGDLFSIQSKMNVNQKGKLRVFVSVLNQEVFDRAYAMLKDETLNVTEQTARSLKGNITVKKDNLMYTSIPWEKGWKVYVDGKRAEIKLIFDAFIGVELTEGEHEIELVYSPGHVYLAVVISLLGIGIFGLFCVTSRTKTRTKVDVEAGKVKRFGTKFLEGKVAEKSCSKGLIRAEKIMTQVYQIVITGFFWIILLLLACMAMLSTGHIAADATEITYFVKDSVLKNVFFVLIFILVLFLVRRWKHGRAWLEKLEKDKAFFRKCRRFLLVLLFMAACVWVLTTQYLPGADQKIIQDAVYSVHRKDFAVFSEDGYFGRHAHQMGLLWLSYLFSIIFGSNNYVCLQLFNAFAVTLCYREMSELCRYFGFRPVVQLMVVAEGILFFPFIQYCSFIYGTIPGLMFSMVAIRKEMDFFRYGRRRNVILCFGAILLALLLKSNYLIFWIGMLIYALMEIWRKKEGKLFLFPALLLAALLIQSVLPKTIAQWVSDKPLDQGISSWAYVVMGLEDGPRGAGWYNGYVLNSYRESGYDKAVHTEMARQSVLEAVRSLLADKKETARFFARKTASQWNNPTFQSFWILQVRSAGIKQSDWILRLCSANGAYVAARFLDVIQTLILMGAILYCVLFWKKPDYVSTLILPLIFVGGFVFHLFWEAKGQYTIPYFVLLLPYAAAGYEALTLRLTTVVDKFGVKKQNKKYQKEMIQGWRSFALRRVPFLIFLTIACGILLVFHLAEAGACLSADTENYVRYLEENEKTSDL